MLRGVGKIDPGTLVLDIGGGSTELVTLDSRTSLDVGAVRLTERHLRSDPPTRDELEACAHYVRTLLPPLDATSAVGVAGTITTLAALDLGLDEYDRERVHGHELSLAGVERQLERLAALPVAQRREVPALEPERAPVIVAGAVIAREVLAAYRLGAYRVSEHDILDGIALAAAELPEPVEGDAPPGAYTCC
jgi:exopolyphosphatase/guanosine-5'-triphosphate,3'-diphosphate pyrophosphatase